MNQSASLLWQGDERKMKKNIVRAANLSLHSATRQIGRALAFRNSTHGKGREFDRTAASSHSFSVQKGFAELNDDSESASSLSFANDSAEAAPMSVSSSYSDSEADPQEHGAAGFRNKARRRQVSTKSSSILNQRHTANSGKRKDSDGDEKSSKQSDHEIHELSQEEHVVVTSEEEDNMRSSIRRRRQKAPIRRKSDPECLLGISRALGEDALNECGTYKNVASEVIGHKCKSDRVQPSEEHHSAAGPRRHRAPRRLRSDPGSLHGVSRHDVVTSEQHNSADSKELRLDPPNQQCNVGARRRNRTLHRRKSDPESLIGASRHLSEERPSAHRTSHFESDYLEAKHHSESISSDVCAAKKRPPKGT